MELNKLYQRGKNLLLKPSDEFQIISKESKSIKSVSFFYSIPMAILVALMSLIGSAFNNISHPINTYIYIIFDTIIVFILIFSQVYLSGKAIILLGKNITPKARDIDFFALTAYSQLPFLLVTAFIKLFPSLYFLFFFGLYSIYLFYTGCKILTEVPEDKKVQFTLLSSLIMIVLYIVCSQLLTILYSQVINQF